MKQLFFAFQLMALMIIQEKKIFAADIIQEFIKPYPFDGKALFQSNCSFCHSIHREMTGPLLGSISKKRPEEWLLNFIRNSQGMVAAGDTDATFLFEQYNHTVMPSFTKLSEQQIKLILSYIETESIIPEALEQSSGEMDDYSEDESFSNGKALFIGQCKTCHYLNAENIGPALGSISKTRPQEWLIPFIKNSQKMIRAGDPSANFLYKKFNHTLMVPFDYLSDEQIKDILWYIKASSESPTHIAGVNGRTIPVLNTQTSSLAIAPDIITFTKKESIVPSATNVFFKYFLIFIMIVSGSIFTILMIRFFQMLIK